MADELTPAETALVRYLGDEPAAETIAALNDAGLRVVLAQDTPSDPAAVLWRVIDPQTAPLGVEVFTDQGEAEVYADDEPGAYVRPLCYADDAWAALRANPRDEHHTMAELYDYRLLYNAHAARGWLAQGIPVVRSWRHADGEPCFGGGWFIVTATLPTGQVSNHYRGDAWDLFAGVPEVDLPPEYDGHTPADGADRLRDAARAPGAVAAAPTEDEVTDAEVLAAARVLAGDRWVDDPEDFATSELGRNAYAQLAHDALVAARRAVVPSAPSAGEDEAAVERAARALHAAYVAGYHNTDAPGQHAEWGDLTRKQRNGWLAAARGPRTQDDT